MLRRVLPLLLLAPVALPTTAHAATTTKKAMWGPVEIESESQFPVYRALGAGIYQTTLDWKEVQSLQPDDAKDADDPSYDWPDEIDTVISEAKSAHLQVALTITGTPRWAKKASDYATFAGVAAKRYPTVRLWGVWDGAYKGGASKYAQLLDGAYAKLKAANKRNQVIGGNSTNASAASWIGKLKLPNGKRPRLDLYGQDVSGTKAPTSKSLKTLEGRVKSAFGTKKLWLTASVTARGAKQASWITSALKATKRDANVYTFSYRGLTDDADRQGLVDADGTKRPAFNAFKRG